ncbi:Peptide deformylase [Pseudocohnilembus persalinus]|uniref:Peptide deformylase n=1 Tax=Pseudocohnilembus persalinus TaxID=266149 RepID=A0A0V0R9J7_PSEPJ|nr:Peptide deformylase [Pseudocohnilembus persalinus]|eukprot:KRX10933.1 Peptide deformylase [Pseudocohnilembus persalinus]
MTASEFNLSSLSSTQIGLGSKIFVWGQQDQEKNLKKYYYDIKQNPEEYKVYLNPKISQINDVIIKEEEMNPCFPLLKVNTNRYQKIMLEYYDENFDTQQMELQDFDARIVQMQLDLLYGKDFLDWRVNHGEIFPVNDEALKQFPKFFQTIEQFKHKVLQMKEDYPELFKGPSLIELNKPLSSSLKTSWEDDINRRLLKNIRKDLSKLVEKNPEIAQDKEGLQKLKEILNI